MLYFPIIYIFSAAWQVSPWYSWHWSPLWGFWFFSLHATFLIFLFLIKKRIQVKPWLYSRNCLWIHSITFPFMSLQDQLKITQNHTCAQFCFHSSIRSPWRNWLQNPLSTPTSGWKEVFPVESQGVYCIFVGGEVTASSKTLAQWKFSSNHPNFIHWVWWMNDAWRNYCFF